MRPFMRGLADFIDTWERFGNALSPTPPFPRDVYRLRLAGLIVPLLLASFFISSYMFVKSITFGVGFGFFGDPIIMRGLHLINTKFPNWQKLLELRNTILKGVPTNAQLTITVLRIGEANKAPLPPPPHMGPVPEDRALDLEDHHLQAVGPDTPLGATDEEIKEAMAHDPSVAHDAGGADTEASKKSSHGKKGHRLLSMIKGSVKGSVETALGADKLKAKVGSEHSKHRLGVIPPKEVEISGPVEFRCRYKGMKGHAYISTKATIPCVSFSIDKSITKEGIVDKGDDELHPIWTLAIADIKELKKVGGLGWKAKLVVGWALDREVADGLEIIDTQGNSTVVTAMILRDELFNRLVAMGGQKWESW